MFGTVRSYLIQQEPLPNVKQVLARIFKEEQHRLRCGFCPIKIRLLGTPTPRPIPL